MQKPYFLALSKLKNNKAAEERITEELARPTKKVRSVKKIQQVVSRTIQTVKSKTETKNSEEAIFTFLKLTDRIKKRNAKLNKVSEPLQKVENKSGSDTTWYKTTWGEVVNFYQRALQDQVLKDFDKDIYLPEKFLGSHYYFLTPTLDGKPSLRRIYSFFINRMLASIFCKISRKQQLNKKSIDKLMLCITDFENLVTVLSIEKDFVKFFVDLIFHRYWELKDVTSPDIMVKFVKAIRDKTTEEYFGGFFKTRKFRAKSYERSEVKNIIAKEINSIRLDAITAVYNCARRDKETTLTKKRIGIFQKLVEEQKKDRFNEKFKEIILKLLQLAEPLDHFDYVKSFNLYLSKLNPKSTDDVDIMIRFIFNQVVDSKRSQELFNHDVIKKLIQLVNPESCFSKEQKLDVIEIINIYLEHGNSESLSENNMKELLNNSFSSKDSKLIKSTLTSLLFSTQKTQSLSQDILEILFTQFDLHIHNEECTSYIVFILSRVFCADNDCEKKDDSSQKYFLNNSHFLELISKKVLCDHVIKLDAEDSEMVQFLPPLKQNNYEPSEQISFLAVNIISRSVENKVILSSATIDDILLAFRSNNNSDKQTKIVASKCLYNLTKYKSLECDILNQLLDLKSNEIYDVSIYLQAAYARECANISQTDSLLDDIHMENISALFVSDSLKLGQVDYGEEINDNFFKTLNHEACKQEFNDQNIFLLFDDIFNFNGKYTSQAIQILVRYSLSYKIPETTVRSLENLLSISSYFEKCFWVLQKVILRGQTAVTHKTLTVFIDYLYSLSNDDDLTNDVSYGPSDLRLILFRSMHQAGQNQELPQEVFFKLELVRAGYALEHHVGDKLMIINFIEDLTKKGMQLPVDTRFALKKEINNEVVLKIFANISKNKQVIEGKVMDDLINLFDPATIAVKIILIKIFENVAKNNQILPSQLLEKLEASLECKDLEGNLLPVFIYFAQKGQRLSMYVINKLLDWHSIEQDPVLRQELLSSLGSLIDANKENFKSSDQILKLSQILSVEIMSNNFNIQKLCIAIIYKLLTVSEYIDDDLLEKLIQIGTHFNCNEFIRNEIKTFFESIGDNCNPLIVQRHYKEKIKLANLHLESPQNILAHLKVYLLLDDEFLPQNYNQLKDLIDNGCTKQQEEVLSLLKSYKYKCRITEELLESVAILFESTMSENLKDLCLQLFNETVENGNTLSGRAGEVWKSKLIRDENLREFSESRLFIEIKKEFQLADKAIIDLFQLIQTTKEISDVKTWTLSELIIKMKFDYIESETFVLLVEQSLIKKKNLEIMLPCYCRLIKEGKVRNVEECLGALVQYFREKKTDVIDEQTLTNTLECLYYANEFTELPDACMQFVLENLEHKYEIIRGYSFATLRTSHEKYKKYGNDLNDWCDKMLERVAKNAKVKIEKSEDYLDLLEVIVSITFFDEDVFKKNRSVWRRELLVSSIFKTFDVFQFPMDQMHFYTIWLDVEKKFSYHKSCKILSLIHNSNFVSFSQIIELISIISEFNFEDVIKMLTIHGPEPYHACRQDWCIKKIKVCSSNSISSKYCSELADKICSSFNISFINELFGCLKSIDNLSTFEYVIDLCSKVKIDTVGLIGLEDVHLNDLKFFIEAKHLCKCSEEKPETDFEWKSFLQIYRDLNKIGWNFAQLCELVTAFNPNDLFSRFQNLMNLLNTIKVYNLPSSSNFDKCKHILTDFKNFQEMIHEINKLSIENHFQFEGKIKDVNELLTELGETNKSEKALVNFIQSGSLNIKELIFGKESDKLSWDKKQIFSWAEKIKFPGNKFTDYEAVAIILRANYLATGRTLTEIQILCSLIALRSGGRPLKGKFLQVATGEGKSTIISILAIINALRGKQVDIITSSPVLAERDAKQEAKLYSMFGLTCSDNNDNTTYLTGKKGCYSSDIVYGEMAQFQFDLLRDNYSKLGTLGSRKSSIAIVDEVDSMLIDESSKIARLSSTVPGMDHFQAVYVFIWQCLISIREKFVMLKNKIYFIYGKIGFENGMITLEVADSNDNIVKIPDLKSYLLSAKDISGVAQIVEDIDDYLRTSLETYLDCQIKEKNIYIPGNFMEFLKKQKSKWISNAIEALNLEENVHYIIHNGEIKPVDYYSTGIVQSCTNWSDGLHQFLQLKHNLKMTSETLTTNFLSNIGFIKKYKQVYGLTGTLGSETARKILKDVYEVELINIPQLRRKQYLELEPIVAQGEVNWLNQIKSHIKLEVLKKRGILVICETIDQANRISGLLKNIPSLNKTKLYTMNDMNQEKNVRNISPGEVLIATNLAGRGMDIPTDEIEESGGLHVILTFMPRNQRVEDQAFGRTARQGKRGTGIMILNDNSLVGNKTTTENIKISRDKMEDRQLEEFEEKELKLIQVKDRLFNKFCSFLNDHLRKEIREKHNSSLMTTVKNWFVEALPTVYEHTVLAAVEEQWVSFLSKLDEGTITCEDAENECDVLISQLKKDFESDSLIKNPYYNIIIANDKLMNGSSEVEQALEYFKKAIELEEKGQSRKKEQKSEVNESDIKLNKPSAKEFKMDKNADDFHLAGAAHLGVAWCLILLKGEGYKDKALSSFRRALKCLSNEMSILNAIQILLEQKQPGFVDSDLSKQLNVKVTILGSYLNGIQGCIEAINRSKRLVDIVAVKKPKEKGILEVTKHFNGLERNEEGTSVFKNKDLKLSKGEIYSLTFNHLTKREDSGTIDQAVIMIKNSIIATYPNNIRINLKQVDLARINNSIFKRNKEFEELTREYAIMKLKEEQSYMHKFRFTKSFETDLKIRSNGKIDKICKNCQINELIKVLEEEKLGDDALRFDIIIQEANKNYINELLKSGNNKCETIKLNVDFKNLKPQTAIVKLSSIKARSVDVEFVLDKSNLLKLIHTVQTLQSSKLYVSEADLFEKVDREELLERVNKLKTDEYPCFVSFEQLSVDEAKNIIKECPESVPLDITFTDIFDFYNSELNDGQVNLSFDHLNRETAIPVVQVLRDNNLEFSLEFRSLFNTQVVSLLENANLEQEDMEIIKKKELSDLFSKIFTPTFELNEFASKGIEYIIEIMEKLFVPWRSVVAVAALGICQVIAGVVLITTGFGSTVGMSLVTEGIADLMIAYGVYRSRQFHWSDYCKQKAISLALSVINMGFSNLKDAAKGIETITTAASREVIEQAGTRLIINGQSVAQTLIKTGKNLKSLAWKFACLKGGQAVGKECISTGMKYLSNIALDFLKPNISESVQERVISVFCNTELMGYLRKMRAIDLAADSCELESRVEKIVFEALNCNESHLQSLSSFLLDNIFYHSEMKEENLSVLTNALKGLQETTFLINHVENTLTAKLKLVDTNSMTLISVFRRHLNVKKDNAGVIANKFKQLKIFDDYDNFQISQDNDFKELENRINTFFNEWRSNPADILNDFNYENESLEEDVSKCISFVKLYFDYFVKINLDSFSNIMKSVSDHISDQMIAITDSRLLEPVSTLVANKAYDSMAKKMEQFLVNKNQNTDSQKADQKKYEELSQKKELNTDEKEFMRNYDKVMTIEKQIIDNSFDPTGYCTAFSQSEMVHYAGTDGPRGSSSQEMKKAANGIRNGEPANIATMVATSEKNGVNLKIVDNKNYVKTNEDIDNRTEVIYFESGSNNQIGHVYYMDSNGQFVEGTENGKNCFFTAFSSILENRGVFKSADDLREETAGHIESNSKNYAKTLYAEDWLRRKHPAPTRWIERLFTAE